MEKQMKITEDIAVGPQPTEDDLKTLAEQGVKTIVNLREPGEEEQPISPDDEGAKVRALGMQYLHIPVSSEDMKEEQADEFRRVFPDLPRPLFGHCKTGKRAGAFIMIDMALKEGWSGEETLQKAQQMGFECDKPQIMEFVKNYIDSHKA